MKKVINFLSLTIVTLALSFPVLAQDQLTTSVSLKGKRLLSGSVEVAVNLLETEPLSQGCAVKLFAGPSKSKIDSLAKAYQIDSNRVFGNTTLITEINNVPAPGKKVFFKAAVECDGLILQSNLVSYKIKKSKKKRKFKKLSFQNKVKQERLLSKVFTKPFFSTLKFRQPTSIAKVPQNDKRYFVTEKLGGVYLAGVAPDGVEEAIKVIDLTEKVGKALEEGVLNAVVDPAFPERKYLYLFYTNTVSKEIVISRFTIITGEGGLIVGIEEGSEQVVFSTKQHTTIHHGGGLAFGPDGYLYASIGDGGPGGDPEKRAQNLELIDGAVIRIDVSELPYKIPADNPFVNDENAKNEIYAYGLRNPWRFSFDRVGNDLWLADVGESSFEEINKIVAGGNYGWSTKEGTSCSKGFKKKECRSKKLKSPIYQYDRSVGSSITGGYVYRGKEVPLLDGSYVFGDFVTGTLYTLDSFSSKKAGTLVNELGDTDLFISSFGETNSGEILIVSYGDGMIYRLIQATK